MFVVLATIMHWSAVLLALGYVLSFCESWSSELLLFYFVSFLFYHLPRLPFVLTPIICCRLYVSANERGMSRWPMVFHRYRLSRNDNIGTGY